MQHIPFVVTIVVAITFLVAFTYILWRQPHPLSGRDWVQYLFLARYQMIALAALIGFGLVASKFTPTLLGNLLVLNTFQEVAIVASLSILAAWVCYFTLRTLALSAWDRLNYVPRLVRPLDVWGRRVTSSAFFVVAGLPMLVTIYLASTGLRWYARLLALLVGWGVALLVGQAHIFLSKHPTAIQRWIYDQLAHIPQSWRAGLFKGYRRQSGHGSATLYFVLTILVYLTGLFFYSPTGSRFGISPPAIAYLLLLLILTCWAFTGLAFFLDRYKIPVFLLVVAYAVGLYFFGTKDYFYLVEEKQNDPTIARVQNLSPQVAFKTWNDKHTSDALPLVVVMASGGGIKASVWTTSVLQALQTWLGSDFADHIVLISSVSGGSVGVLHYMDAYEMDGNKAIGPPTASGLQRAVDASITPSLADAIWGLSYPDLLQNGIGLRYRNRGWAIEQAWRRELSRPDTTLEDWRADVSVGTRPPVLFNSTIMDNGALFVFTALDERNADDKRIADGWHSIYFNTAFPAYTVQASTAARMSATFPYISPIARPMLLPRKVLPGGFRLADGGYFDNYGIVSALEWLAVVKPVIPRARRSIILIRIEAALFTPDVVRGVSEDSGLVGSVAGPAFGALNSLFTAQKWRNDQAIDDLAHPSRDIEDGEVLNRVSPSLTGLSIQPFTFAYPGSASLSWQLSQAEIDDLRCAVNSQPIYDEARNLCVAFFPEGSEEAAQCKSLPTLTELSIVSKEQCE